MKKIKNKKTIIILLVLCIGLIGLTIAYFSNSTILDNLFSTKEYGTTYTETFVSPDNWLPGDTTDKTVTVTNSGSVDEAVRISLTEEWKSNNGTTLSGLIDENGLLTDIEENSEKAAIINFSNIDDWTYNNGYYYYNYRLKPNETTSSFIESVTFNPKVSLGDTCQETESNGKKTITCNSSGDDYDNATYKLTLTIETVQYNKYMSAWNTDIAIANDQALFCDAFEVGELVTYNGADYYVLKDSSTSDDYVTLLKKDPLTASEVNQYSDSYVSQDGEYPYYESDTCSELTQTGCSTNYDTSNVKKIVDGWSSSFGDDLVEIDGYKVRLVNEQDLISNLAYEFRYDSPYNGSGSFYISSETPLWANINEKKYWSINENGDSSFQIYIVSNILLSENIYNRNYIRPVIHLRKKAINGICVKNSNSQLFCNTGSKINYNNEEYYVMKDFDEYVVALKKDILLEDTIRDAGFDIFSLEGEYPYYKSVTCNNSNHSECSNDYNKSSIKKIVDYWSSLFEEDLINVDGYKARLIDENDLINYLRYDYSNEEFVSSLDTPNWINYYFSFWTMINDTRSVYQPNISGVGKYSTMEKIYIIDGKKVSSESVYVETMIRPVINLKKSSIENGCSIKYSKVVNDDNDSYQLYPNYSVGQVIKYNNENYCVINHSNFSKDYVTLIKQNPLTYNELVTYNNGFEIGGDNVDDNVGTISYYKSNDCYYNSDYDKKLTGCSINYDTSNVKIVVNNWSNTFNDELKEINGYKARLINNDELNNMGHIFYYGTAHAQSVQKSNYDCLYIDADYWTMSSTGDIGNGVDIVSKINSNNNSQKIYNQYAVRPVINLKKCAITNTCE